MRLFFKNKNDKPNEIEIIGKVKKTFNFSFSLNLNGSSIKKVDINEKVKISIKAKIEINPSVPPNTQYIIAIVAQLHK